MIFVNQKFNKPPKKTDTKAWKVVELLLENDFLFQSVYENKDKSWELVKYPKTLEEAQEFIKKYEFLPNNHSFIVKKKDRIL